MSTRQAPDGSGPRGQQTSVTSPTISSQINRRDRAQFPLSGRSTYYSAATTVKRGDTNTKANSTHTNKNSNNSTSSSAPPAPPERQPSRESVSYGSFRSGSGSPASSISSSTGFGEYDLGDSLTSAVGDSESDSMRQANKFRTVVKLSSDSERDKLFPGNNNHHHGARDTTTNRRTSGDSSASGGGLRHDVTRTDNIHASKGDTPRYVAVNHSVTSSSVAVSSTHESPPDVTVVDSNWHTTTAARGTVDSLGSSSSSFSSPGGSGLGTPPHVSATKHTSVSSTRAETQAPNVVPPPSVRGDGGLVVPMNGASLHNSNSRSRGDLADRDANKQEVSVHEHRVHAKDEADTTTTTRGDTRKLEVSAAKGLVIGGQVRHLANQGGDTNHSTPHNDNGTQAGTRGTATTVTRRQSAVDSGQQQHDGRDSPKQPNGQITGGYTTVVTTMDYPTNNTGYNGANGVTPFSLAGDPSAVPPTHPSHTNGGHHHPPGIDGNITNPTPANNNNNNKSPNNGVTTVVPNDEAPPPLPPRASKPSVLGLFTDPPPSTTSPYPHGQALNSHGASSSSTGGDYYPSPPTPSRGGLPTPQSSHDMTTMTCDGAVTVSALPASASAPSLSGLSHGGGGDTASASPRDLSFAHHTFHMDQRQAPNGRGPTDKAGPGGDEPLHPFLVEQRNVLRPQEAKATRIISSKGTVRGLKNLVRAGIASFADKQDGAKNYRQLEKGKVIVYTTSVKIVRETYDKCLHVKKILQTHMVKFEERDIFVARENQREFSERLEGATTGRLDVPQVFADGQHIGGYEELERMNENGELRDIFKQFQRENSTSSCAKCGGFRYMPCHACHGSKKSQNRNHFIDDFYALRCTTCDENGLVRCELCTDTGGSTDGATTS